jgi:hypothetical protein
MAALPAARSFPHPFSPVATVLGVLDFTDQNFLLQCLHLVSKCSRVVWRSEWSVLPSWLKSYQLFRRLVLRGFTRTTNTDLVTNCGYKLRLTATSEAGSIFCLI